MSMVGLSCAMKESNVVAPIRSPAAAKIVFGLSARSASTAPAYFAAPGMSRSGWSRPWKSLVPMIWMSTGSAALAGVVISVVDVATSASPAVAVRARMPRRVRVLLEGTRRPFDSVEKGMVPPPNPT